MLHFQQGQSPFCQLNLTKVNDGLIDLDRDAKVLLGFLEEKLKTLIYIYIHIDRQIDRQIQIQIQIQIYCPIQFKKMKDWTLAFQKISQNFKSYLKSTVMIEANSWKNRRKLLQQSQQKTTVSKPAKFFLRFFSKFEIFDSLLCYYFNGILCTFHVAQMLLNSY